MADLPVEKVSSDENRTLPVFDEFEKIADQIRERAFNLFASRGFGEGNDLDDWLEAERQICWPKSEITEKGNGYELDIALAGYKPEEVSVTATPSQIIVKAEHETSKKKTGKGDEAKTIWSEFRSENAYRRFALPMDIDVDKIEASYRDGMLAIKAPKRPRKEKVVRKVDISSAA